jgi:hypothetical protein
MASTVNVDTVAGVQLQSGPVPRTNEVITECYKWHTTAEETKKLKSILHFPLKNTQRQAREFISGPCLGTKARLLSFNRMQSRAEPFNRHCQYCAMRQLLSVPVTV